MLAATAVAPAFAEPPPASGQLLRMEAGDVSCYLHLRTALGSVEIVHADFELCDLTSLIGERVAMRYKAANVLAASCEGDVDCGRSDRVMLAVSMTRANSK